MTPNDALLRNSDPDAIELTSTLRNFSGLVPDDSVDWSAFHARLAMRAELSLARLRYPGVVVAPGQGRTLPLRRQRAPVPHAWWEHAARWSRMVIGSAVAAGVALVAVIRLTPKEMASHTVGDVAAVTNVEQTRAAFELAVIGRDRVSPSDAALSRDAFAGGPRPRSGPFLMPGAISGGRRRPPAPDEHGPPRPERALDAFARELELTPEQLVVADSILRHEFQGVNDIREDTWPKMQAIMDDTRRKLDSVLSPAQRERYHAMLADQDRRFRPRDGRRSSFP